MSIEIQQARAGVVIEQRQLLGGAERRRTG